MTLRIDGLTCCGCQAPDLVSVLPGHAAVSCSLFDILPEVPMRGYCMACWTKRFSILDPVRGQA